MVLLAIGVYFFTIPLPDTTLLSESVRLTIYNYRPYALVALLILALAERWMKLGGGSLLSSSTERRVLLVSLAFPTYYLVISIAKHRVSWPVVGLYLIWPLFSFLLTPLLIRSMHDLRLVLGVVIAGSAGVWLYGVYLVRTVPSNFEMTLQTHPYGYQNADYFAQVLLVFVAALVLYGAARFASGLTTTKLKRRVMLLAYVATLGVLSYIAARSAVAFLVTAGFAYLVLRRSTNLWAIGILLCGGALLLVLALFFPEQETVDSYSSRRLTAWSVATHQIAQEPLPIMAIMVGPVYSDQVTTTVPRYDELRDDKVFEKFHIDNTYLELIVEGGTIGLFLFMAPYVLIFRAGVAYLRRRDERSRLVAASLAMLIGLAFFGLTASVAPTFNSPVGFFAALIGMLPAIIVRISEHPVSTAPDAQGALAVAARVV